MPGSQSPSQLKIRWLLSERRSRGVSGCRPSVPSAGRPPAGADTDSTTLVVRKLTRSSSGTPSRCSVSVSSKPSSSWRPPRRSAAGALACSAGAPPGLARRRARHIPAGVSAATQPWAPGAGSSPRFPACATGTAGHGPGRRRWQRSQVATSWSNTNSTYWCRLQLSVITKAQAFLLVPSRGSSNVPRCRNRPGPRRRGSR